MLRTTSRIFSNKRTKNKTNNFREIEIELKKLKKNIFYLIYNKKYVENMLF